MKKVTVIGNPGSPRMRDLERASKQFEKGSVLFLYRKKIKKSSIPSLVKKVQRVVLYIGFPRVNKNIRSEFKHALLQKHTYINDCTVKNPDIKSKYTQQLKAKKFHIPTIPSFQYKTWKEVEKKLSTNNFLSYPFIIKKNIGSQGKDVHLIHTFKQLEPFQKRIRYYTFQPFIPNNGDFRIFIIRDRILGTIERTAKKGEYRNNISQGGSAQVVTDKALLKKIQPLTQKIRKIFQCDYAGIDLIQDKKTKKLYFLEINFMPQWQGFAQATKVDVAQELLKYAFTK